jgi:hypothetical protein
VFPRGRQNLTQPPLRRIEPDEATGLAACREGTDSLDVVLGIAAVPISKTFAS